MSDYFELDPRIEIRMTHPAIVAVWDDLDRPPRIYVENAMSDNSFEKRVGLQLRELEGVWVYHPPDDRATRQWKPGDFIFGHGSHWGVIETKEVQGATFPISRWTPQQRASCEAVLNANGVYWLLVRFQPSGTVAAFHAAQLATVDRGSLKAAEGRVLNVGRSFDLSLLIATRPLGTR